MSPWLPRGFWFLSGLPEAKRKRRILMPIQVFVDDSGGKGHSRHLVLAGLIAPAEQWAQFSDAWAACLRESPTIHYFKMRQAAKRNGPFGRFSEVERDDKLRKLAHIINLYADTFIFSAMDLDAHETLWRRIMGKPLDEPYFQTFQNIIIGSCLDLWDRGHRERFEIVFDERAKFGPRAKVWYPLIRELFEDSSPDAASLMPIDPMFRDDKEFLPIQAADLFAWFWRQLSNHVDPNRHFDWLINEMPDVSFSSQSHYIDQKEMANIIVGAVQRMEAGSLPAKECTDKFVRLKEHGSL